MRKVHTKRYNKQVPGHHIQMDVKFLTFAGKRGEKIRRFQYTAIEVLSDQSQLVSVWCDLGQKHRLQAARDCQSASAAERRSL